MASTHDGGIFRLHCDRSMHSYLVDTLTTLTSLLVGPNAAAYAAICSGLASLVTGLRCIPHQSTRLQYSCNTLLLPNFVLHASRI